MACAHFDVRDDSDAADGDGAKARAGDHRALVAAGTGGAPSAEPEGPSSYRAMMFGADGRMVLQAVIAADGDDEAKAQAMTLVDGHSVDLWDQLRFIERFEPDPAPAQGRTLRARSSDRTGMRRLPNEDL